MNVNKKISGNIILYSKASLKIMINYTSPKDSSRCYNLQCEAKGVSKFYENGVSHNCSPKTGIVLNITDILANTYTYISWETLTVRNNGSGV